MTDLTAVKPGAPAAGQSANDRQLWKVAQELEAAFLTEMLKSTGFGSPRDSFDGGIGEEQFGSFLRQAEATEMVRAGGIGLAEAVFDTLKERTDGIV